MTTFSPAVWLLLFTFLICLPPSCFLFSNLSVSVCCVILLHFSHHLFFFFITAPSLHLCLRLCPQSQQIYSGGWVQSASCGEYLHTKWSQPDFNEAAAFSLELLFIRLMSDNQKGSLVVLFYHFSLMREGGEWPYRHKRHRRFPHLNGLISRVDACWPK